MCFFQTCPMRKNYKRLRKLYISFYIWKIKSFFELTVIQNILIWKNDNEKTYINFLWNSLK